MKHGIDIAIVWDGAQVNRASVAIRRLSGASLLVGRSTAEVIDWVPRLYSLCGKAQTVAARMALAAARRETVPNDVATARSLVAEQAQEHLWRLLRDWPPLLGVAPRDADLATWFRRLANPDAVLASELRAYVEKVLLQRPIDEWLELRCFDDLVAWAVGSPAHAAQLVAPLLRQPAHPSAVRCLDPALRGDDFAGAAWDSDYARWPTWRGGPAETGAYARWRTHPMVQLGGEGLLARLLARLLDLVAALRQLADAQSLPPMADAVTVADNVGLARVDTARGTLMHRVELSGDKVAAYTVVAPTEWNFHPRGGFVCAAERIHGGDFVQLRREVSRWVLAYDPCVDWTLELQHA